MKTSTVILILIVAALLTLFVVGVVLGSTREQTMPTRAQLESWAKALFEPSPVQPADLRWEGGAQIGDPPSQRRRLGKGKRATLYIAASEDGQRKLTVMSEDELSLKLVREGVPDMEMKTKRGKANEIDFQVDDEGGRIELGCKQGDDDVCTVRIE